MLEAERGAAVSTVDPLIIQKELGILILTSNLPSISVTSNYL